MFLTCAYVLKESQGAPGCWVLSSATFRSELGTTHGRSSTGAGDPRGPQLAVAREGGRDRSAAAGTGTSSP